MNELGNMLADVAGRIFSESHIPPHGAMDVKAWELAKEAGLHRLLMPEDEGGAGDAFKEATSLAVLMGLHGVSLPLLETIVANWCLLNAGLPVDDNAKALIFSDLVGGVVHSDHRFTWLYPIVVPWPDQVVSVVIAKSAEGSSVSLIEHLPAGVAGFTLAGDSVKIVPRSNEGLSFAQSATISGDGPSPISLLALLKAAALAGLMDTTLDMAIEYANTRKQFGRPIGQFQAVQHMIVRMCGETAASFASVHYAAERIGTPESDWAIAIAKGFTSTAAGSVAAVAHQVHGAIGFTAEFALQRYTRRLLAWREDAGDETYWYRKLGDAALRTGERIWPAIVHGAPLQI